MNAEQLNQVIIEVSDILDNKGLSYVCYVWDKETDIGGGCNSDEADLGDVLVVISRLIDHFNINPDTLYQATLQSKLDMERN